jgi:hypothetical protein
LGERLDRTQEVTGSSPVSSISVAKRDSAPSPSPAFGAKVLRGVLKPPAATFSTSPIRLMTTLRRAR